MITGIQIEAPFDTAVECTTDELAKALAVDYATARGFIALMEKLGEAKLVGKRPAAGGRGKPTNVYLITTDFRLTLEVA